MKPFLINLSYEEGDAIPHDAILQLHVNPKDNYAFRLVYCSPFVEEQNYVDPMDFQRKRGATQRLQALLFRKGKDNKRRIISTGPIFVPIG